MNFILKKIFEKQLISILGDKIAELRQNADNAYYNRNDLETCKYFTYQTIPLERIARRNNIEEKVLEYAYTIYDFRNSGEDGYNLIDGKLVKVGRK